jgi:hypothetical protein
MSSSPDTLGLWLLLFVALAGVAPAIIASRKVIEFPFMMGGCLLVWILPQAYFTYVDPESMTNSIFFAFCVYASICVLAGIAAYHWYMSTQKSYIVRQYDPEKSFRLGLALCCLGFCGYIGLWLHGPVEGPWTGWPVYFITLAKVSFAGIPLLLISYFRQKNQFKLLFIVIFLLPVAGLVFERGRRSAAFDLISLLMVVAVVRLKWKIPRFIISAGLVLAMVIAYCFPIWRQTFPTEGFVNSIRKTSVKDIATEKLTEGGGSEFRDSSFLFDTLRRDGKYNYGLDAWNRLVQDYFPGSLMGRDVKSRLMIFAGDWDERLATAKSLGRNVSGYTAKTGFNDAFIEFGYWGPLLFGCLGVLWARFTRPAYAGDDTALHFLAIFALNPAHFVYSGIILRFSGDLVGFVIVFFAMRHCTRQRFLLASQAANARSTPRKSKKSNTDYAHMVSKNYPRE